MERLKHMKECLLACAEGQMGQLSETDTKELGEVIDMIKDLDEAIYYCTITKAMNEKEYLGEPHQPQMYYTDGYMSELGRRGGMASAQSRGYGGGQGRSSGSRNYGETDWGRYERRNHTETQNFHGDKAMHMRDLDKYVQELSADVSELIHEASPEEKQSLQHKIQMLSEKIQNA